MAPLALTRIGAIRENEVPAEQALKCVVDRRAEMEPDIGKELYRVIDALVALKIDLRCDPHVPGETLVLSADRARDACEALETASASIKHLAGALNGGAIGGEPRH
jgi:hypothetical protein